MALVISAALVLAIFLVLPVASQQSIVLNDCPELLTSGPCAPQSIPTSLKPLLVVLVDSEELLAPNADTAILRNLVVAFALGTGFYLVNSKRPKLKKKTTSDKKASLS